MASRDKGRIQRGHFESYRCKCAQARCPEVWGYNGCDLATDELRHCGWEQLDGLWYCPEHKEQADDNH